MTGIAAALLVAGLALPAQAFDLQLDGRMEQGGLVVGTAPAGATITFGGHKVPVTPSGHFLLGLDRDATATATVTVTSGKETETRALAIKPRDWEIEHVDGLQQQLVTPDPVLLAKIAADQKQLNAARAKLELTPFFETGFIRPAEGRVSGHFGSQRILNGTPRAPHTGLDIAAPIGTPVHAAADGIISLRALDMVLTGNTVMINHGYGLQTMYIHMSKITVTDGQKVKQGDVIGEIGMTGRATGPHLHFSATWFDKRLDPETLLAVLPAKHE